MLSGIEHTLIVQSGTANVQGIKIDKVSSSLSSTTKTRICSRFQAEDLDFCWYQTITTTYQPLDRSRTW